ncbi:hypothetical protein AVEN_18247-1 [Araneus ventricosus]|uniref:Uncharacterized protein n=1 Tax=Araneus ventricosus TaxID=182803 RepID=A0A4Y2AL58_ARAVE|nr:hypothetical protein AVEN_18247-1 [Araneus ventricosus]
MIFALLIIFQVSTVIWYQYYTELLLSHLHCCRGGVGAYFTRSSIWISRKRRYSADDRVLIFSGQNPKEHVWDELSSCAVGKKVFREKSRDSKFPIESNVAQSSKHYS